MICVTSCKAELYIKHHSTKHRVACSDVSSSKSECDYERGKESENRIESVPKNKFKM